MAAWFFRHGDADRETRKQRIGKPWYGLKREPACSDTRLEPVKRAGRMVREHLWGSLNAIVLDVTNAGSESINARIQRAKKMACGCRNRERFKTAIMFHVGGLDLRPESLLAHSRP